MPKFFVSYENIKDDIIFISGDDANHLINVLRIKKGEKIIICDSEGFDYTCEIHSIGKKELQAKIIEKKICQTEPPVKITLFQALPKSDKMDLIIQKCIEIGIFEIVPYISENTIVKIESFDKKLERYKKISESAAKQSGRGTIPNISNVLSFEDSVELSKKFDKAFVCYENEKMIGLNRILNERNYGSLCFFIGPEGGFSKKEIDYMTENNILSISLGKRILRTETAALVFLSVLLYEIEKW